MSANGVRLNGSSLQNALRVCQPWEAHAVVNRQIDNSYGRRGSPRGTLHPVTDTQGGLVSTPDSIVGAFRDRYATKLNEQELDINFFRRAYAEKIRQAPQIDLSTVSLEEV